MTGNEGLLVLLGILNEVNVWMPRPEDVVVQKLRWAKGGARSKDFDDVVSVLMFQRELDFTHIEHWGGIHGTLELLEEARSVAGE